METSPKETEERGWIDYLDQSLGHKTFVPFSDSSWSYTRKDVEAQDLKEKVLQRLYTSPLVDASFIEVDVVNGHVLLTGKVFSEQARQEASKVVETTEGVWSVENDLHVILTS